MIRRLREYYRQFEELSPEEISAELRERRDEERSRALAEVPALDLTTPAWHEPPDAEAVNAATYALRRAVNAYPDDGPLREALAARHDVTPDQIAPGHGAGELLHAAFRAIDAPRVAIAWPGWGPLPRLVHEAGGTPIPVPFDVDELLAAEADAVVVCTPNDPTGATIARADLERIDERVWLIVDAALAEFGGDDAWIAGRERILVVRSFSKAHAMAGFRAGYALSDDEELIDRLSPAGGVSAPAQAAMLWAIREGGRVVERRRATAARERERLAAALEGTSLSFPDGHGHLVWLSSSAHEGAELSRHLAARRIYVTPGSAWGDEWHVRVALRDGAATDRLLTALEEL